MELPRCEQLPYWRCKSQTIGADVVLANKGTRIIRAPLALLMIGLHSDYGVPVALNASGTKQGQPFWDASASLPIAGLVPKAASKPLRLHFKLLHFRPPGAIEADAVAMQVRITQPKAGTAGR